MLPLDLLLLAKILDVILLHVLAQDGILRGLLADLLHRGFLAVVVILLQVSYYSSWPQVPFDFSQMHVLPLVS